MYYPLFLQLAGKRALVVGGGAVGARKAVELVAAGARVTVVSPAFTGELPESVQRIERCFEPNDVDGAWLVIAATNDASVQAHVAECAARAHAFVIAVDDLSNTNAISPAIVRRGAITIAISSGGETPALTRLLRELIEQILPEENYVEAARTLRARWKREHTPVHSRFHELLTALRSAT